MIHGACQPPSVAATGCTIHGVLNRRDLAARIDAAIGERNASELARKMGVRPGAVSNWRTGLRLPDSEKLEALCRLLGVSADELLDLPTRAALPAAQLDLPGSWSAIPRVSEQVAAGEAVYDEAELSERDWYVFRDGFLRHLIGKSDPEPGRRLVVVTVARGHKGESMLPTIRPGALVLVDRGPGGRGLHEIDDGKVYLCRPRGEGVTLKRVFRAGRRALMLWADNPTHKPQPIELEAGERMQDFVLGRVRWIGQEED